MTTINWTGSRGNKIELRARCEISMATKTIDLDGDIIESGKEPRTKADLELWVDDKKVDSCWNTAFWKLIDCNGYKKVWGLPVMMTEEQAEKVEKFLNDIIENGKSEDVKEHEAAKRAQEKAEETAEAKKIINAAETTRRNEDGTLMTQAQARAWQTRYNNLHNEGGEGYVPEIITREDVKYAEAILAG